VEERILEFIGDLRRAELRISTSEALDALSASAEVGLVDRESFKSTLAATLVKEARDLETFDRIFNLYFLDLQALGEGLRKALGPEDPRVQDLVDKLVAEDGLDLDDLSELLLRGGGAEMEMAIRAGSGQVGLERLMYFLQVGYFSRRIQDRFDLGAIERDFAEIMRRLEARGLDPGQRVGVELPELGVLRRDDDRVDHRREVVARAVDEALREEEAHYGKLEVMPREGVYGGNW